MSTPRIIELDLESLRLEAGKHEPDGEYCVMELVAFVAGEPWTDAPSCTSPVIAAFLRRWNDGMSDTDRQILKRFFVRSEAGVWTSPLIGTAGGQEIERRRAFLAADWSSRTAVPCWLRACGGEAEAAKLEALAPVTDRASAEAASSALRRACDVASRLRDERRQEFEAKLRAAVAAVDAWAAVAAVAAVDAVAAGAAGAAVDAWAAVAAVDAWDAVAAVDAWDAVAAVAALIEKLKAANATTYKEVYTIARPHFDEFYEKFTGEKLRPAVVELQQSACELVDRMVACR